MVHKELKKLRKQHDLTLKELSSRVGYGTGNLSSYENGRLHAKDETVIRILTRGYTMSREEAKARLAMWRRQEVENKYKASLAEVEERFNEELPWVERHKVVVYLKEQGVSPTVIEGVLKL